MKLKTKKIVLGLCVILSIGLIGCSNNKEKTEVKENIKEETIVKKDIPENLNKEVGEGTIILSAQSGTSQNGNVPSILVEKDLALTQIDLAVEKFDTNKLTYIYVDGILNQKEKLGDMSQVSITLEKDALKNGNHTVDVIQYENDTPSGKVINYKTASYEVKMK